MITRSAAGFAAVLLLMAGCLCITDAGAAENLLSLRSPDDRLVVTLTSPPAVGAQVSPLFSLSFRGRELLRQSSLGMVVQGTGDLLAGARLISVRREDHDQTYRLLTGKQNPVRNHYRQAALTFESAGGYQAEVFVRAFNDGVALRYGVPKQAGLRDIAIADEKTAFRLTGNPRAHVLYLDSYTTSHEGLYETALLNALQHDKLIALPALFEYEDGTAVAITEANLQRYAGMYLKSAESGALISALSPLPGQSQVKVKVSLPMVSPWRVILVGNRVGRLIESTVILNLNEPSRLADTSWIKPGKTTWHWWNGTEGEPAGFETQLDLRTMRHYVDFAARHGIAYHAVASTVESDSRPWHQQTQRGFAPGPDTDILKPRPELEFEELARYAASKGVGLRAWVHWKALKPRLDEAFAQYERWGLCGLMVDFLDRDDQEMVEFAEQVLEKAAQHRLHIQFHGVWKPTGRERAYPNLFNHEGVLNLEYLKWSENPSPEHNLMAPFTRMLAGPMDYHLGGFRAVRREKFKPRGVSPTVMGTRTHHLAMYVVYENPMPMVCDYPTAYENQPGFDFIERVPTVWDETRVLSAQVGDYIVVARRNANDWYLGAMTDWTPRSLEIPLDFLGPGSYVAEIWSDAPETAGDPDVLVKDRRSVLAQDTIRAKLSSGGGWVLHVKPAAR